MNIISSFFLLMALAVAAVAYIMYGVLRTPSRVAIYHENPPSMESSHAWGYQSRPWWRRYEGVPGMGKEKPHPPTIAPPTPGKYVPSYTVKP